MAITKKSLLNPTLLRAVGVFLAALASQPAVQALAGGGVPLTRDAVVAALLGAAAALLHRYLPGA
jgi:hypothetical protein